MLKLKKLTITTGTYITTYNYATSHSQLITVMPLFWKESIPSFTERLIKVIESSYIHMNKCRYALRYIHVPGCISVLRLHVLIRCALFIDC